MVSADAVAVTPDNCRLSKTMIWSCCLNGDSDVFLEYIWIGDIPFDTITKHLCKLSEREYIVRRCVFSSQSDRIYSREGLRILSVGSKTKTRQQNINIKRIFRSGQSHCCLASSTKAGTDHPDSRLPLPALAADW